MLAKYLFPLNKSCLSVLWKTNSGKLLPASGKHCILPNIEVVRYRARKGTRAAALAIKKARKLQESNKPVQIPKYLQRKVNISSEAQKARCKDENWLEAHPIDNVWNMKLYRGKPYTVTEAVKILRDQHIPSIMNDPTALINITAEIDLKLKKKDKFMDEFRGIMIYPHEYDTPKKNNIIVVCKESVDQLKATEAGAVYAGSTALIKQILSGTITSEDFDYVVCHPDIYKELNSLRGILKRKYPTANNGLLRLDIEKAVASFIKGVEYVMTRSSLEPDFGWVDVSIGRLNMPLEEIEANIKHALETIEKNKPAGTNHILFMIRCSIWCQKTRERIKIPHWEYLSNYPVNGIIVEDNDNVENVAEETAGKN